MDIRPVSIQDLFDKLKDKPSLRDKISLQDNKLTIVFGEHYKIDVIISDGFCTHINDILFSHLEEQDVVDVLTDIAENNYYVIEKKRISVKNFATLFPNERFLFLTEQEFSKRKKKLLKKSNIKIFNFDKVIYDS